MENYLNVGCGNKFHSSWTNVDMTSNSPHVLSHNLLRGMPFPDDRFDVVYHSQVLEHIPKKKAPFFVNECFRVLKPGGIMRVVVPDLENIAGEYLKQLADNIRMPSRLSEANYDWIMLEMYDQAVRNYSKGQMAEFMQNPELENEKYIVERIGCIAKNIRDGYLSGNKSPALNFMIAIKKIKSGGIRRAWKHVIGKITSSIRLSEERRIGAFRLSGEVHNWMYDRFSLSRLLKSAGFEEIVVKSPCDSGIPDWEKYELDIKDGAVIDPMSLFMEARKPKQQDFPQCAPPIAIFPGKLF